MAKIAKGIGNAAARFLVIGVAIPYAVEYFAPTIGSYIKLPPATEVWEALILLGALFAVTSFLQTAYSNGEFPWLFGKIGAGLVDALLFTYLFLLLPNSFGSSGVGTGVQSSGLLTLVYLAVALSYGYLILDFVDHRRSRAQNPTAQAS
ncbi:MAG TPA: hypothetical protein VLX56_06515 [Nitrososphaerales archaeon]|nr:hypothetical protein [Nitrososphaerales archaeon]